MVQRSAAVALRTSRLNPFFPVEGVELVLQPLEIVSVADKSDVVIGELEFDPYFAYFVFEAQRFPLRESKHIK